MSTCSFHECSRDASIRRYCPKHYNMLRRTGVLLMRTGKTCSICGEAYYAKGLCYTHYKRQKHPPRKRGSVNSHGYKCFRVNGKTSLEHRMVMEAILGRELLPGETVHHINGVRHDNRPENLELWVRSQCPGQRVEDKLRWAHEILDRYGDTHAV